MSPPSADLPVDHPALLFRNVRKGLLERLGVKLRRSLDDEGDPALGQVLAFADDRAAGLPENPAVGFRRREDIGILEPLDHDPPGVLRFEIPDERRCTLSYGLYYQPQKV